MVCLAVWGSTGEATHELLVLRQNVGDLSVFGMELGHKDLYKVRWQWIGKLVGKAMRSEDRTVDGDDNQWVRQWRCKKVLAQAHSANSAGSVVADRNGSLAWLGLASAAAHSGSGFSQEWARASATLSVPLALTCPCPHPFSPSSLITTIAFCHCHYLIISTRWCLTPTYQHLCFSWFSSVCSQALENMAFLPLPLSLFLPGDIPELGMQTPFCITPVLYQAIPSSIPSVTTFTILWSTTCWASCPCPLEHP